MARGRMLNRKISLNKAVADLANECGCEAALWYTWTIAYLDVDGRFHGDPHLLKQQVCPRISGVTPELIRSAAAKAHELGLIEVYEADGDVFIEYPKFVENQQGIRKDREAKSTLPPNSGVTPEWVRSCPGVTPELLPLKRREEKRREEKRKEKKTLSISAVAEPDNAVSDVQSIFDHYRTYHPRAHKKPSSKSKEWRLIKARFSEGYSVGDLCKAIDGCHLSRFHQGDNDRGKKYDSLELIVRDGSKVNAFIETAENPDSQRSGPKQREPERSGCWARDLSDRSQRDE